MIKTHRIVLTGGPGAGKTTAADLFRREMGGAVQVVPEAATMLFSGGFPRTNSPHAVEAAQLAIFHVQKSLEAAYQDLYPGKLLICDRGTVDGSIYWPHGPDHFFASIGSSLERQLQCYQAVIFFETAAAGQYAIDSNNPIRQESLSEALRLDRELIKVWGKHQNFHFIPHQKSFVAKINKGLECLSSFVARSAE